jgi:hypothetical protein
MSIAIVIRHEELGVPEVVVLYLGRRGPELRRVLAHFEEAGAASPVPGAPPNSATMADRAW